MSNPVELVRLGDFISLVRGTTYKSARLGEAGPHLLGLASIARDGGFRGDSLKTYGGESAERHLLRPGDIYVSLKDVTQSGDLLGSVARVPEYVELGRLTQDTVKLDFEGDAAWRSYVYWSLRAPEYRAYCRAHAIGTTNLSLSRDDFLGFGLKPINVERQSIVDLLEALEDKIELNRNMSRTLDYIAQAIFKSWFVDFDDREVDADTLAPSGWVVEEIGRHVEAVRGLSYTGSGLSRDGEGVPLLNLNSVLEGGGYDPTGLKWYSGEYRPRHVVASGDLLVANTDLTQNDRVLGYPVLVPNDVGQRALFSHHLYRVDVKAHSHLSRIYLFHLLREPRLHRTIWLYANGTTVNMLPTDGLSMPKIVVPPRDIVEMFTRLVEPMGRAQEVLHDQRVTLEAIRDALLPRLLSGQPPFRVPQAIVEKAV